MAQLQLRPLESHPSSAYALSCTVARCPQRAAGDVHHQLHSSTEREEYYRTLGNGLAERFEVRMARFLLATATDLALSGIPLASLLDAFGHQGYAIGVSLHGTAAGADWEAAVDRWRRLPTDDGAEFDRSIAFDAGGVEAPLKPGWRHQRCRDDAHGQAVGTKNNMHIVPLIFRPAIDAFAHTFRRSDGRPAGCSGILRRAASAMALDSR